MHQRGLLDWQARRAWLRLCVFMCVLRVAMIGEGWCCSGEVHGPQGVVVDLNSFGQRLGVPTVTLTGHMAALTTAEGTRREDAEQRSGTLHI